MFGIKRLKTQIEELRKEVAQIAENQGITNRALRYRTEITRILALPLMATACSASGTIPWVIKCRPWRSF